MNNLVQKKGLSHYDIVSCHLIQCQVMFWQGKVKELIKHAEHTYLISEGLENNLFRVDSLLFMTLGLVLLDRLEEAFNLIKQGEELIKVPPQELSTAYKQTKAYQAFIKGYFYSRKSDVDLALEHLEYSLEVREELGIKHEIAESLSMIAYCLGVYKGELDNALKYAERGVTLAKESTKKYYIGFSLSMIAILYYEYGDLDRSIIHNEQSLVIFKEFNNKLCMAYVLNNLSCSYKMRGELDRALECIGLALALNQELGRLYSVAYNHDYLIQILIEMGDLERAKQYLRDMEKLKNQLNNKSVNLWYLFDKALILKTSDQVRDRSKAEDLFKHILEDKDLNYELAINQLLNLCEILIIKLSNTGNLKVLDEILYYLDKTLDIAKKSQSYWLLAETYFLQAQLELLTLDLNKAKESLVKAQQIAEEYRLDQLTERISIKQDKLLSQTNKIVSLKRSTETIVELSNLTPLKEQIQYMLKKRQILKKFNL